MNFLKQNGYKFVIIKSFDNQSLCYKHFFKQLITTSKHI
jgi:hypothetical protein